MYHISDDKRARKSADLIVDGLIQCLREKEFSKITIADINKKSYVSRSTFYRLFDNTKDVLSYQCDQIFDLAINNFTNASIKSLDDFFKYFIDHWMNHSLLLETIITNNFIDILYSVHIKNSSFIRDLFSSNCSLTDNQLDYLISLLTSSLVAFLSTWIQHKKNETCEELLQNLKDCYNNLNNIFNN